MTTVAIDFDGVLHPYTDGWCGHAPSDEPPAEGALDFLMMLETRGLEVVVFSCRADSEVGRLGIVGWLTAHGLARFVKQVTNVKPMAAAYVDDRAVTYRGDFLDCLVQVEHLCGKPTGAFR